MLYVTVCAYFWAVQVEEIFAPMKEISQTPDEFGMAYDGVKIPVGDESDHAELDGFWVPANHSDAPTFLYLHGRDASIGKNLDHKAVVATADCAASSLRSGRLNPAVPHFRRSRKNTQSCN